MSKNSQPNTSSRVTARRPFIEVVSESVTLPNGRETTLEVVRHPGASAVVPFLDDDRILMIRQYRYAVGGFIHEVPAGKLDPGETPAACALRELEEETGQRAGRLDSLGSILTTPGFTDERIHLFAGHELEETTQRLEDDELIELVPMNFVDAIDRVFRGEIPDAKSALALIFAARKMGRLS
jgi:ADP-ribose pyrophosphatase